MSRALDELFSLMSKLRAPEGGCSWDRAQTWRTLAPFTLEEAYEVVDAIEREDNDAVCEELGDLLFQIVFISQIAVEQRLFDFEAVAHGIADKLRRRHPHIFKTNSAAREVAVPDWEALKAAERQQSGTEKSGHLAGVPRALPALTRADKLSRRAARVGFDFESALQCAAKVEEEWKETSDALRHAGGTASAEVFEEVGDLLFAVANLARKLSIDPESALRAANTKFERRFKHMEALAQARTTNLESLSLEEQEALWLRAKRAESNEPGSE